MVTASGRQPVAIAKLLDFGLAKLVSVDADVTRTADGVVVERRPTCRRSRPRASRSMCDQTSSVSAPCCTRCSPGVGRSAGRLRLQMMNAVVARRTAATPDARPRSSASSGGVCRSTRRSVFRRWAKCGPRSNKPRRSRHRNRSSAQPSIAVLPFANMSADKENEYFSDGLAEEIINVLANMPWLEGRRPHVVVLLPRKGRRVRRDRQEAQCRPHPGGECSKGRQPNPGHGAADQGRRRFSSLVGALRPRDDGHLCDPG